jgi:transferase CAF17, mitochondrial
VLRSKVKVKDVSDEWRVFAVWGGEAEAEDDRKREESFQEWTWNPRSNTIEPKWRDGKLLDNGIDDTVTKGIGTGQWDRRVFGMGRRILWPVSEEGKHPQVEHLLDGHYMIELMLFLD